MHRDNAVCISSTAPTSPILGNLSSVGSIGDAVGEPALSNIWYAALYIECFLPV